MTGRGLGEARYWREETGQGKKAAEAVCRREPEVTFPLAGPTRRFWDEGLAGGKDKGDDRPGWARGGTQAAGPAKEVLALVIRRT